MVAKLATGLAALETWPPSAAVRQPGSRQRAILDGKGGGLLDTRRRRAEISASSTLCPGAPSAPPRPRYRGGVGVA